MCRDGATTQGGLPDFESSRKATSSTAIDRLEKIGRLILWLCMAAFLVMVPIGRLSVASSARFGEEVEVHNYSASVITLHNASGGLIGTVPILGTGGLPDLDDVTYAKRDTVGAQQSALLRRRPRVVLLGA
jgi:hypothetical protein